MTAWLQSGMARALLLVLVLVLAATVLAGCGFHLRGLYEVPAEMRQLRLDTGNAELPLVRSLKRALRQNGIELQEQADYQLKIIRAQLERSALTLNTQAQVDEYELHLDVEFEISHPGRELKDRRLLQNERIYSYDADDATAKDEQEQQLRNEMRDAIAQSIVRHYLSLAPRS